MEKPTRGFWKPSGNRFRQTFGIPLLWNRLSGCFSEVFYDRQFQQLRTVQPGCSVPRKVHHCETTGLDTLQNDSESLVGETALALTIK